MNVDAVSVDTRGNGIAFRRDIEGLRAVAIIPVVLQHAGLDRISGGYLGVDIFFVVSGYLITRLIVADVARGQFSLARFYRKRARRILPALAVVILATLVLAAARLTSYDIRHIGTTATAAAVFSANIFFFLTTDYFRAGAAEPLMHLWSLGVEEQFYLLYPIAFATLFGRTRGMAIVALSIAVAVSLAVWLWWSVAYPTAAFFLLPARLWELGMGALVAVIPRWPVVPRFGAATAALGLTLITAPVLFAASGTVTAIAGTVAVVMGTTLVLATADNTLVGRLLALAPLRAIGRISYSLYLWHWPIISFYRLETGNTLDHAESLALVAASVAAALLSYLLVEQPFRRRGLSLPVAGFVLGALAAAGFGSAQLAKRIAAAEPAQVVRYLDPMLAERRFQFRAGTCFLEDRIDFDHCVRPRAGVRNVIVAGDSYAAQLWRALAERNPGRNVMQATVAGCYPLLNAVGARACTDANARLFGPFLARARPDRFVLAANWQADAPAGIGATVRYLRARGIAVTVIGAPDRYDGDLPRIIAMAARTGDRNLPDRFRLKDGAEIDAAMASAVRAAGGDYVSLRERQCRGERCLVVAPGGSPLQFDSGHLTISGARFLLRDLQDL